MAGRKIPVTQGKFTVVDPVDYALFGGVKWYTSSDGYAVRGRPGSCGREKLILHREILAAPRGMEVDHINGDKLDNRRCNLRLATRAQNSFNRKPVNAASGFKGVYFQDGRYKAALQFQRRTVHLGHYDTAKEAAHAYNEAATEYYGDFASLNKI